ncbi:hypothetical protein B0T16DRAFT_407509 [Cercophora newfieldiana]|uniref:F-box domain-containing protein n=1 Tax=Cercophora newfieldiana TaxID=92897 RepID=A0AA39YIC9_9PEZI|nr:hypothetical protein B0T16DRAFT_407509 [Cercophora newfieldiana]
MKSLLPSRHKPPPEKKQLALLQSAANTNSTSPIQDFFSKLPIELLLLIFQHLTTSADILSALNVCRAWRGIFLAPEIWPALADRHAPGLTAYIRASCPTIETESSTHGSTFHSALLQQHLHLSGHFTHATHYVARLDDLHDLDTVFRLSKTVPVASGGVHSLASVAGLDPSAEDDHVLRLKLYSHGRVAWWPEGWHLPYFSIIDDLRTRVRRMYLFPGQVGQGNHDEGQRGWKTALGERLFVMGQEAAGVCVWHLDKDEMKQVELPGAFDRCVVERESLLFVGRRWATVWIWTWGTGLVKGINVAALGCYAPGPVTMGGQIVLGYPPNPRPAPKVGLRFRDTDVKLDFILHPTNPDVFFAITYDELDLVVHEITSGKLTARIVCPHDDLAYRIIQRSRTVNTVHYLRHERCDAYGGYCLMTAWIGIEPVCECEYAGSMGSVCFNVHTKRFTGLVHHCLYQRTPDTHLWNCLLAVGVTGEEEQGNLKPVVALLMPCDGDPRFDPALKIEEGLPFPVRSSTTRAERPLIFAPFEPNGIRPRAESLYRMAYALEAGGGAKETGLDVLKAEWLNGDDKTLVYVHGKEYTVWTFGKRPRKEAKKEERAWRSRLRNAMVKKRPS